VVGTVSDPGLQRVPIVEKGLPPLDLAAAINERGIRFSVANTLKRIEGGECARHIHSKRDAGTTLKESSIQEI